MSEDFKTEEKKEAYYKPSTTNRKKYRCQKHLSNEGYTNDNGEWVCWFCYAENLYLNPKGTLIKEYSVKKYTVRIIDRGKTDGMIAVELFDKDKVLIQHWDQRDLSIGLRKYVQVIEDIEKGIFRKNRRERNSFFAVAPSNLILRTEPAPEREANAVVDEEDE